MQDSVPYADIVLLALIAGFILLRLRSVLGQKTGNDNPQFFQRARPEERAGERVVQVPETSLKLKAREEDDPYLSTLADPAVTSPLQAIKAKDPQFSATAFLSGAKLAFEMVFDAFVRGDKNTLKMLLSSDLYEHFSGELAAREKEERRSETTLVAVTFKAIKAAALSGSTAKITVQFSSEQVTVVRDKEGKIVEGDPSEVHHVEDEWVFERDTSSKNPNWKIIET